MNTMPKAVATAMNFLPGAPMAAPLRHVRREIRPGNRAVFLTRYTPWQALRRGWSAITAARPFRRYLRNG